MKKQILIERFFQAWLLTLGAAFIFALGYSIFQLATGNIPSTSAFEI